MTIRALLLSQRKIADLVAFCVAYEFEDTIAAVCNAERVDVPDLPAHDQHRRLFKLARIVSGSYGRAKWLAPAPRPAVSLRGDFDIFLPVFNNSYELYSLSLIPDWRQRCKKAACFITEIGSRTLPTYLIELLSDFDHIFLGTSHGIAEIARITGKPCSCLSLAADVLRFAPSPNQVRPIDVCNIGRRSAITHQALIARADQRQSFYYYDTVAASGANRKDRTFRVDNPQEHRRMLATLLKNSSFFIANRGYINRPEFIPGGDEIAARFYEGAAAGTVLIGDPPHSEAFRLQFDWPDALIHVPFDSPDIDNILSSLQSDPDRIESIRRTNIGQAASRHDWLHRIETVFGVLGLAPTEKMLARAAKLERIASEVTGGDRAAYSSAVLNARRKAEATG